MAIFNSKLLVYQRVYPNILDLMEGKNPAFLIGNDGIMMFNRDDLLG